MRTSRTAIAGVALLGLLAACGGSAAAPAVQQEAGGSEEAAAQSKGSADLGKFKASGLMTDARQTASAVRLDDGRVFVAGGRG